MEKIKGKGKLEKGFIKRITDKHPMLYILGNTAMWFVIGMLISYYVMVIPLLNQIEFLNDGMSLAAFLAFVFGYIGSCFYLLKNR